MCRYAAYLGSPLLLSELIYLPPNSLVHQATDAMMSKRRINADGFGVGWYAPQISPEPAVFKDASPVWNNHNLTEMAGKIASPCILAHVRAANSSEPVTRENCHPFRRGRLLWMHNGDIPGRARLTRYVSQLADDPLLAEIRGTTDSEQAFTLFLTCLQTAPTEDVPVDELARAMESTIRQIVVWHDDLDGDRPLEMNFCVASGSALVAVRFAITDKKCPTLHWRRSDSSRGGPFVVVASEPLSEAGGWSSVANGEMLLVDRDLSTSLKRLGIEQPTPVAAS